METARETERAALRDMGIDMMWKGESSRWPEMGAWQMWALGGPHSELLRCLCPGKLCADHRPPGLMPRASLFGRHAPGRTSYRIGHSAARRRGCGPWLGQFLPIGGQERSSPRGRRGDHAFGGSEHGPSKTMVGSIQGRIQSGKSTHSA